MTTPSDALLQRFIEGFYGYGNPRARWWFVGQEEGGARDVHELSAHLSAWSERGSSELEDLAELQRSKGVSKYFGAKPKFHPYWGRLARLLVEARGDSPISEKALECQGFEFGRVKGDTCLVELSPLPKPDRESWYYEGFSKISFLRDPKVYMESVAPARAARIRELIASARPEVVVFCSTDAWFLKWWKDIAGVELVRRKILPRPGQEGSLRGRYAHIGGDGPTYVVVQNPSGAYPPHMYWSEIAALLRKRGIGQAA